jgi:hypothetical protein
MLYSEHLMGFDKILSCCPDLHNTRTDTRISLRYSERNGLHPSLSPFISTNRWVWGYVFFHICLNLHTLCDKAVIKHSTAGKNCWSFIKGKDEEHDDLVKKQGKSITQQL